MLVLVAGLSVVTSAAARAVVVGTVPYAPAQGPVLGGSRLVYVPSRQSGAGPVRIEAAAGAHSTVLARLSGEPARTDGASFTGRGVLAAVAATPTTLVATVTTVFDLGGGRSGDTGQHLSRTWAGRLGGPLAAVSAACVFPRDLPYPSADGDQVATEGMGCGPLEVLDVASQTRRALPPTAVSPVVVAGSLTAWLEPTGAPDGAGPGAAVVADATGRELLRVPVALVNGDVRLTLDPDGTLALFGHVDPNSPNAVAVVVATAAQPVPRVLPIPAGSTLSGARLAHGRVATLVVPRGANAVTGGEVLVTDTAGTRAHTVLRGVGAYGQDRFAFDGQNVAAIANRCDKALLVRASADGPATDVSNPKSCALILQRRPRWSGANLTIALSCRGLSDCQAAHVTARLGGPRGALLGRASSDRSASVALPVKKALRRRIAGKTTKVWLRAQLSDGAGTTRPRTITVPVSPRR
ncbi:hypothetical protein [Conexibacter woesei]|uniref:hypothetical protein n=1 Tax=Conexibacter woesei TaxID=191495 RepID=UPI00054EBE98|nr:hypothetical protein [Conexibacter woesei]